MGEVFRARDTRLDRIVAIKTSKDQFSDRFTREARAIAALNHPNIATLYDVGPDYLVMEFVDGETLPTGLPITRAIAYARQILDALEAAHRKGIFHRDLKPANIMIGKNGVKLLDFGLAQITPLVTPGESTATVALSTEGTISGTLQYMSPEQLQGKTANAQSDIFSFALVFYEMLTGRPAFSGDNAASIISAIMTGEPARLQDLQPLVTPGLERLLQQCLLKEPDERWQSAGDVRRALDLLDNVAPPAPPARRSLTPWVVSTAVTAVLVAGAAYYFAARPAADAWSFRPLTYSGRAFRPSISPDGKQVAFLWSGEKDSQELSLYLQLIAGGAPLRLENSRPIGRPEWSPDGVRLAFLGADGLYVMPALGGKPRRISNFQPTTGSFAWGGNGTFFVVPREGLHRISADGGETRPLTAPGAALDHSPAISPDSGSVAFVRRTSTYNSAIFVMPLNSDGGSAGNAKQITDGAWDVGTVEWSRDGREILFEASTGSGNPSIWRIPRDGGKPVRFPVPTMISGQLSVARQADRMVYVSAQLETGVNKLPLDNAGGPIARIVETHGEQRDVSASADGKKIAFVSNRTGAKEVWAANADGSEQTQLTSFGGPSVVSPRWSPDGKRIAFDAYVSGSSDIYVVSVEGGNPQRLTNDSGNEFRPSWSHDGQWVYFGSNRGSDRPDIWKISGSGGARQRVTKNGGNQLFESADGRWFFFDIPPKLLRMRADGSEEKVIRDNVSSNLWNVGGRNVYVLDRGQRALLRMPLDGDTFTSVHRFSEKDGPQGGGMAIATPRDESFMIYRRETRSIATLILIEGFR